MKRIYTASKLATAQDWKALCRKTPSVIFHARWLKHQELKTPDSPSHARIFWVEDEQDVKHSDAVLVWAKPGEHLRGALVEAGIAIASGIPVIVIGKHPDYGTWQYHPMVIVANDIEHAIELLKAL